MVSFSLEINEQPNTFDNVAVVPRAHNFIRCYMVHVYCCVSVCLYIKCHLSHIEIVDLTMMNQQQRTAYICNKKLKCFEINFEIYWHTETAKKNENKNANYCIE